MIPPLIKSSLGTEVCIYLTYTGVPGRMDQFILTFNLGGDGQDLEVSDVDSARISWGDYLMFDAFTDQAQAPGLCPATGENGYGYICPELTVPHHGNIHIQW